MTETRQNWFEANPKKTLFSVIIISFLAIDFGTAAFLKAIGKFEPSYVTSSIREAYFRKANPIYHHDLAANINAFKADWGGLNYLISINSLGFKDTAPREVPLTTTQPRLLIIGDSFTEGVGVEYPDTFAGKLDTHLAKKNISVLNAAATSYAPIIYYRKVKYLIETKGIQFDRLMVFVDLSDMEDEALGYEFDENENVISRGSIAHIGRTNVTDNSKPELRKPKASFKQFFTDNTVFLAQLRNLSKYIKRVRKPWDRSLNKRRGMWTLDDALYKEYGAKGVKLAELHMTQLKQLVDKHHIKMTLVIYPWPDQIYHKDINSKHVKVWQNWSRQNNVTLINLFPTFINMGDPKQTITDNFFQGDVHWNKQGHDVVYQALVKTFHH